MRKQLCRLRFACDIPAALLMAARTVQQPHGRAAIGCALDDANRACLVAATSGAGRGQWEIPVRLLIRKVGRAALSAEQLARHRRHSQKGRVATA